MKTEIEEMHPIKMIITTCDECGKEIGHDRSGKYDGHCCSVCGRSYCYECHKRITIKNEKLMMHYCNYCAKTERGIIKLMIYKTIEASRLNDQRFKMRERWKERSLRQKDGEL